MFPIGLSVKTISITFYFLIRSHIHVGFEVGSQFNQSRHQEKPDSLCALLNVADVVAAHCACSHVADERKEFILCQEKKQSCIKNVKKKSDFHIKTAFVVNVSC